MFLPLHGVTLGMQREHFLASCHQASSVFVLGKGCSLTQSVPFPFSDFIILSVWTMLAFSGVTVQLRQERSKVPFPPHPYLTWKRERERRSTNVLDPSHHIPPLRERIHNKLLHIKEFFHKEQPAGERTPLLL